MYQRIILDAIFEKKLTSRAELSSDLHISKPAVTDNLKDLISVGIVQECGEGEVARSGGRKPRLLRFNSINKYIVAVESDSEESIIVLGNLKGDIIAELSEAVFEGQDQQDQADQIKAAIYRILHSKGLNAANLACISMSFMESFNPVLSNSISEEFNVAVLMKNDVHMSALGEFLYGAGLNSQNVLYICCGSRLGSGLILGSKLYETPNNFDGGIFNGIDPAKLRLDSNLGKCIKAYQEKSPTIVEHLVDIGIELGCTISNITNLLSLDTVILGGEYVSYHELIIEEMEKIVSSNCLMAPKIVPSQLGQNASVMGLFAISREKYFDSIVVQK